MNNVVEDGRLGVRVYVTFDISNLKDLECGVGVNFNSFDGTKLLSPDENYRTADGQVYTRGTFKPPYVRSTYTDFPVFLPYEELHLIQADYKLRLFAYTWAGDKILTTSDWVEFSVSAAQLTEARRQVSTSQSKIEAITVEYNADWNGTPGMMIYFKLTIYDVKDVECTAVAFFYNAKEEPLPASGNPGSELFASASRTLLTQGTFTPNIPNAYYERVRLFIPYREFTATTPGRHPFKFFIAIRAKDRDYFIKSGWVDFWVEF